MSFVANKKTADLVRRLLSSSDGEILAVVYALRRTTDLHELADHIEKPNGGLTDVDKEKIRAGMKQERADGYAEGVRAAEARFRPDGTLEFSEVALFAERQINRIPPDKHEFIRKMALYARQQLEPSPKQGKFLFDLFVQYLGGRIT